MARFFLKRLLPMAFIVFALLAMGSCSESKFRLKAKLKGLGSQNVKVVYFSADGNSVEMWKAAEKDVLMIEGSCASPSLFIVYNSMNVPVFKTVVSDGDEIEVEGKIVEPYEIKIKGSETAEKWNAFVLKYKKEYQMTVSQPLNAEIEKYVKQNPNDLLSTILVLVDYVPSDISKTDKLLESIDDSAKPLSLMNSYNTLKSRQQKPITSIRSMNLLEMESQDLQAAVIEGSKPSVLMFWSKDVEDQDYDMAIEELKMIDGERVQIMDINIDSDSVGWYKKVDQEGSTWKHYWVPGSIMNSQVIKLQITSVPTIIVTDSTGVQKYRGDNAVKARQTVEGMIR